MLAQATVALYLPTASPTPLWHVALSAPLAFGADLLALQPSLDLNSSRLMPSKASIFLDKSQLAFAYSVAVADAYVCGWASAQGYFAALTTAPT
jgi:hypothetical protein